MTIERIQEGPFDASPFLSFRSVVKVLSMSLYRQVRLAGDEVGLKEQERIEGNVNTFKGERDPPGCISGSSGS